VLWWEQQIGGGNWQSLFDDDDTARPALLEGFKSKKAELALLAVQSSKVGTDRRW